MTPSKRWQEIDRIFAAALEHEPAARAAFLDKACAGDGQLRQEVESLLAHDLPESLAGNAVEEATRLLAPDKAQGLQSENVGPYQIVRSLGAGGMGQVYLAHDKRLNRPVAVKLLAFYDVTEEERIRRFRQEALAASALNHPNILTIYEIGEAEGHHFIATEFIDGQTLLALIGNGNASVETAVDIAIQTASALSAAHAAGIVHRDIKPANIMLRADGLLKVLDFGIAKFSQQPGEGQTNEPLLQTLPGTVIGTAAYMSPEQARGKPIDSRTDIWSLGVILYELITGRHPFLGDTLIDVMSAVIERQPAPLSTHNPSAPEALQRIVSKALQKEREARYQTAAELHGDLKELKQKLERQSEQEDLDLQQPATASQAATVALPAQRQTDTALPERTFEGELTITSSGESLVARIKHHKYAILVVILIIAAVGWLAYRSLLPHNTRQIESIAVMPFVNDSGNSEVEYLSDGMTDMLITSLSQLPKLSVKARSSVFRYKNKDTQPQQLGRELNVQAILNGRVVQRGNDLTLHIELVDVQTETALWSRDYNRAMTNLVALQGEIARDVSQNLRARLSGAEEQKVTKDYTANAEAYQLYLKGRFHVFKLTPAETLLGISYFQQAIQLDPKYALAYVGLSEGYRSLAVGGEMRPTDLFPKAKEAAAKALDLDDALAEAHTAVGVTLFWHDWKWNEAEDQYKRALELNPNSADAHLFCAHLLSVIGRHVEALAETKRARELDPYSPFVNTLEGQFLLNSGKPDEALTRLRETFELAPGFWFPHIFAASAYVQKGMFVEAIAEARRAKELSGAQTLSEAIEGYALVRLGKGDEARALLDKLLRLSKERFVPPIHIASLYNALGETDQALTWLERGYEQRDPKMVFLKVEPKWDNLRAEPRFVDLMKRMGFQQ